MSVIVVGRMKVDPANVEKLFASRKADFEAIAEDAKKAGALHHEFAAGEGVVVFRDEWKDAESFQKFFQEQTKIASLMQEAGVAGPPDILVYRPMDSPDKF